MSLPRCKSTRNWSYYSRNKCFHACLCRDFENYTRPFIRIRCWCAFHEKRRVLSVEHVNRSTAIQGKSMRIQNTNQWLPRVSVFPHVSLGEYREQAARVDRQLLFHCERYSPIVIYFQVKFTGILIREKDELIILRHLTSKKHISRKKDDARWNLLSMNDPNWSRYIRSW